ncbi:major pollen allergen Cyn d 1-like isoform X3 [Miscanthus floridulus]|uniref:major pollen allergen Cyn d 1-like isoform X3 n=1 Tax=Miscanthus floridulus TaxID=154761 RepID=UPI0034592B4D
MEMTSGAGGVRKQLDDPAAAAAAGEGREDVVPGFDRRQPGDAAGPRLLRPRSRERINGLAADGYCQAHHHEQWNSSPRRIRASGDASTEGKPGGRTGGGATRRLAKGRLGGDPAVGWLAGAACGGHLAYRRTGVEQELRSGGEAANPSSKPAGKQRGGACGFKNVNLPPFSAMTSCGNQPLFKDGKGCGSCYQIRCVNHPACSGNPETVMITDMNYYPVAKYHFDLSGTAFGAMAQPGRNNELRHAGIIDIQFRRVPCIYPGQTVTFHIEHGSNPNYLAVLVEFEDGDGDVVQVDIMEANSGWWTPMRESWGSIWRMDSKRQLQGPFSLRITDESGETLVAYQVIPANWAPNTYYRSNIQYEAFGSAAGQAIGSAAGQAIGSAVGLVISSAAELHTEITGIIGLICLVLYHLHGIEVP